MATMEETIAAIVRAVVREELAAHAELQRQESAPELLTVDQAALVAKVHHSTIREWVKDGSLPSSRPNRRTIRIKRDDLFARLARSPQTAAAPPTVDAFVASVLNRRRSA